MLVIAISRIIMFYYHKRKSISILKYSTWILLEILSMAAFYALFGIYFLNDDREFLEVYKLSIRNTALILLLPYAILYLYFSWKEKTLLINQLVRNNPEEGSSKKMLPFHDEKGELKFSIKKEDLLYLEASDNYVSIHYVDGEKTSKFLIRNTLKKYEESLDSKHFTRCHRSYIVNFERVKIIKKEKDGMFIELDTVKMLKLPVSKTYIQTVMEAFSKFSG